MGHKFRIEGNEICKPLRPGQNLPLRAAGDTKIPGRRQTMRKRNEWHRNKMGRKP